MFGRAFCGMEVNTYSVMTNHFHILLHVLPERELTDDELASRVAAVKNDDSAPTKCPMSRMEATHRA